MVLVIKNPPDNARDMKDTGSIAGWGRPPGGGHGNPTSVFLPGKFHGQRSLMGYIPEVTKSWTGLKQLSTHACRGCGESRKGSSNQRSGVCHISPLLRESLSRIFLPDCSFPDARTDGGWREPPILGQVCTIHSSC